MKSLVSIIAATVLCACDSAPGPTTPTPPETGTIAQSTVVSAAPAPAPTATPTPPTPRPGPTSIVFNADGSGRICTTAPFAARRVSLKYTQPGNERVLYIPERWYIVPAKSCTNVISALSMMSLVLVPRDIPCGTVWRWHRLVQIDATAGQGEHIGHVLVDVSIIAHPRNCPP